MRAECNSFGGVFEASDALLASATIVNTMRRRLKTSSGIATATVISREMRMVGGKDGGCETEDGGQRTENGGQRTENRARNLQPATCNLQLYLGRWLRRMPAVSVR